MRAGTLNTPQPVAVASKNSDRNAIVRLTLTDFRCYRALRLEVDERPVVLTGPNGAGKTNLLEAISFLVPGRGLRGARLGEVTRRNRGKDGPPRGWGVAATFAAGGEIVEIGTGVAPGPVSGANGDTVRRAIRIDGIEMPSQAALGEKAAALWLTPDMERLFNDGSAGRRRFLDRLVFSLDGAHPGRTSAYHRAMRERARLLRDGGRGGPADPGWLDALESTMVEQGVAIVAARTATVGRLNAACDAGIGPFPAARLALDGIIEDWLVEMPALEAEDRFRASLAAARPRDAHAGGAAVGPHLSDLCVTHLARQVAAAECSTGEQKALLISIVLANARLRMLEKGAMPLLLLDEVASHLDDARRSALFEEILVLGAQAWLTGTDSSLFAPFGGDAQHYFVENARLRAGGPDLSTL